MPAPLSDHLRQRVVDARLEGSSVKEVAERYNVGTASVKRWTALFRRNNSVSPKPHNGGPPPVVRDYGVDVLWRLVVEHPTWTVEEYCEAWCEEMGVTVHRSSIQRALSKLELRRKKGALLPRSGTPPGSSSSARSSAIGSAD